MTRNGDPWASYSGLTFGPPPPVPPNPFAVAQLQPAAAQQPTTNPFAVQQQRVDTPPAQHSRPPSGTGAAEQQRVDLEDELSDSREEEALAVRQQPRGYTTLVPQTPLQPVGVFTPLYRRSGPVGISERQLHRVMQSQEMTRP